MPDNNPLKNSSGKYDKILNALFVIILLTGLFLRFYQYFMGRSLWEDETHFALNFIKYDYIRLSQPLDFIQAAPIFFIYATKFFCQVLGYTEYAFRLTPFLFSILTLPLFYYIILELTKKKVVALIGFFIFSVNIAVIYFSSELKPYGVDVGVYLLLVYLAVGQNAYLQRNRHVLLAVAGCLSILFSNVAFIVMACIVCYAIMEWYKAEKINRKDILVWFLWAVVFVVNYFIFIYHHPSTADQKLNYAFAFCPTDVFSPEFSAFFKARINEIFFGREWTSTSVPPYLLYIYDAHGFAYILLLIFIVAILHLVVRKQYTVMIFILLPVLLHLVLSALKIYPFWFRLILYLVPCFIFIISLGTYVIAKFLAEKVHFTAGAIFVLVCTFIFVYENIRKFPLWPLEIKPAINFVNKTGGLHVYVTTPVNAYRYYTYRGYAKDSVYKELPWDIKPQEFYEFVSKEKSNYIIFYGVSYHEWPYKDAIDDMKARHLEVNHFQYSDYAVSVVKPLYTNEFVKNIDASYFDTSKVMGEGDGRIIPFWGNDSISTKPFSLTPGKYELTVISNSTPAGGIFSHGIVYINSKPVGGFTSSKRLGWSTLPFEVVSDAPLSICVKCDNDANINGEDRNLFVRNFMIHKAGN
jgi:hypothetical protein